MQELRKMKVKKGWLAVQVGLEEDNHGGSVERFVIPISYLYHPLFQKLLDKAYDVYGYHTNGPLRLPCSVDDFLHLRWQIEKETSYNKKSHGVAGGGGSHQRSNHHYLALHHHLALSLSFHSC